MGVSPAELEHWQKWLGKPEMARERIEPVLVDRYAAALGEGRDSQLPSLVHWAFFLPAVPPAEIGPDGHPKRGGFLPPVTLAQRMFAASDIRFLQPLEEGKEACRRAEVVSLVHKVGRQSGDLVLLEVAIGISQGKRVCIEERQTIVYREAGGRLEPVIPKELPAKAGAERWLPGPVDLFRFSAVTFNSHRIHYDFPYATEREGYPGLVVHGPFTAARLHGFARRLAGPLGRFSFRATAPLFAGQPVLLETGEVPGEVVARRCDGVPAMTARFEPSAPAGG